MRDLPFVDRGARAAWAGVPRGLHARRRWLCSGIGVAACSVLPACASGRASDAAAQNPELLLDLQFVASPQLNPNEQRHAAPVLVRLYELASPDPFESVDYFALSGDDKAVLGASCLLREEWVMRPGEQRRVRRGATPGLGALGVTVAYRDLSRADWRACRRVRAPQSHWWSAVVPTPVFRARVDLQPRAVRIFQVD